jgi:hypothetical protein
MCAPDLDIGADAVGMGLLSAMPLSVGGLGYPKARASTRVQLYQNFEYKASAT